MARLPSRGKKAARGAAVSKLQRPKVNKPALAVPSCPPGCAVVSADLLHHLQQEVGSKATPRGEPMKEAIGLDPLTIPPAPPRKAVAKQMAQKDQVDKGEANQVPLFVKHAAVSTSDEVPPPPGARHASVGTVDAVEEGTQTIEENNARAQLAALPSTSVARVSLPVSARGDDGARAEPSPSRNNIMGIHDAPPVLSDSRPVQVQAAGAQPGEAASQNYGRCEPFHLDRITAEKDRDRKRAQAQMLAEQIQEQRERKEEEIRRQREEERMEEQRVARELREIEERHRREQAAMAAKSTAAPVEVVKVPTQKAVGHPQARRRRSKDPSGQDLSPTRGGGTYDGSTAGTWVDGEDRRRRRRRRRREVDSTGGGQDGSWASERDKRTWRDENYSSLSLLPDGRDTSSPVPWLTASPQDNADGPDALSTVLETGEMKHTEARRIRGRRRRERREFRDRGDSYDENDTWESAQNRKSQDDLRPQRLPDATWARDQDDEQRRRRGRAPPAPRREHQEEQVPPPLPAVTSEKDRSRPPATPMMSEAELNQIRSLVRVCEQLLRERAEEKEREAAKGHLKGSPKQAVSPARRSDRLSPRHASGKESGEEVPRGNSGAALASARSQATKNSQKSGNGWNAQPSLHAEPALLEGGSSSPGKGASDMHSWGGNHVVPEPPTQVEGDPGEWSSDALVELMNGYSRMVGVDARPGEIPEATPPRASGGIGHVQGSRPPLLAESPFASPARGVALRRSSRRESRGGLGDPNSVFRSAVANGWGGRMLASPPPISRGGLNVQASWEPHGLDRGGRPVHPFHKGSRHSGHRGPGQVPIGINPSIQAQSAMLREMYPNVAMGGPGPGPLSLTPGG